MEDLIGLDSVGLNELEPVNLIELTLNDHLEPEEVRPQQQRAIRADLQILRAISIVLVVLYHLQVPFFSGGFVGVDIFFVLSGYLVAGSFIGNLLKKDHPLSNRFGLHAEEHQRCSILQKFINPENDYVYVTFLGRRIKRLLFPSSLCLILVLIGVNISPLPLPNAHESIRAASLNYLNFYMWSISGAYGGTESSENIVLHFWSLSVEWQFYFIFPLVFLFFKFVFQRWSFGIWTVRLLLAVISIPSFILCFFLEDNAKFYLLPTRIWEFLFGAFIFLEEKHFPHQKIPKFLVVILMGVLCFCGYHVPAVSWPNGWVAYVVGLTGVIIICQKQFENDPFVSFPILIGDWSYSIYLYHWPIIVFAKFFLLSSREYVFPPFFWGTCLFLTIVFGPLSFYVVEKTSSTINCISSRGWIVIFIVLSCTITGFAFIPPPTAHVSPVAPTPPPTPTPGLTPTPTPAEVPPKLPGSKYSDLNFPLNANISWEQVGTLVQNSVFLDSTGNVWLDVNDARTAYDPPRKQLQLLSQRRKDRCMLIIGDSHGHQWHTPVNSSAEQYNASFYRIARGCMPTYGPDICAADKFLDTLPDGIVNPGLNECKSLFTFIGLFWRWNDPERIDAWKNATARVLLEYAKRGPVLLFTDFLLPYNPRACIKANSVKGKNISDCNASAPVVGRYVQQYLDTITLANHSNIDNFNLVPYLTHPNGLLYAYNDEIPLFFDNNHISEPFAVQFTSLFKQIVERHPAFQKFLSP